MEAYQIILTYRDPQNLHEERRNPQLESQEGILNEKIMNMLRIMSHDIREPLISMSATLKLLSRGYYGKMDEGVANNLKELLSKTVDLIGITEEYLGSISCEAPRPQAGASRKGNLIYIVPLDPAYKAGLAWHLPVKKIIQKRGGT